MAEGRCAAPWLGRPGVAAVHAPRQVCGRPTASASGGPAIHPALHRWWPPRGDLVEQRTERLAVARIVHDRLDERLTHANLGLGPDATPELDDHPGKPRDYTLLLWIAAGVLAVLGLLVLIIRRLRRPQTVAAAPPRAEDNTRKTPVMLHRAVLGSMERFIGILIEHYAGAMPVWLAPVQTVVMSISEHQAEYALRVTERLQAAGVRVEADLRGEKISYKIREHSLQKLPYQVVVGDKEVAAQRVAVRTRKGEDLGQMSLEDFISRLKADESRKGRTAGH